MGTIELRGVEKWFGDVQAVAGVDLVVGEGELAVFVGPSGCGKSTLLRLIAGLEEVSAGAVLIDGRDVTDSPPAARKLAMVFQSYALYPHMTAGANMGFALRMAGMAKREIAERVAEAARILRIGELLERRPRELSGGQRQRVAIGRAIVRHPAAFLFDEPLSNLDAALRVEMRLEITRLHRELGATMIYVTHDQIEAMTLADRIVVLNEGRVEQVGAPMTLYEAPRNLFVAQFIGSPRMNVMACAPAEGGAVRIAGQGLVRPPAAGPEARWLGVRPEHVSPSPPGAGQVQGAVELVENLGADVFLHVDAGEAGALVARAAAPGLKAGEKVALALDEGRCHLFDGEGRALGRG